MVDIHVQAEELFWQACRMPREQRTEFLAERCVGDAALRAEVESLLAHHDASDGFLADPPLALPAPAWMGEMASLASAGSTGPGQIGRYRIMDVLGEGGMGIVYRAEQDNPRRVVALKVIRPGVASSSILRRFAREAQVLGRLQHPGIAQIHEAGTFDAGGGAQPFFAMELVDGRPITEYARDHDLSFRERLSLMTKVCLAVEHAHRNGVIHRDLKPSNVLVTDAAGERQIKILDFGVARVIDSDLQISTLQTDVGQLIGTIPYMSPEQISGKAQTIDARSDVYALGVLCYELLTGRKPYDLTDRAIPEAARVVREEDPTPLSSLDRGLRGDVETIIGKALEKDAARRYSSAVELAEDLTRFLRDEPIVARPPSAMYQLRKFARRNKALAAGATVAFVTLVVGVSLTSWQAIVATRQRERALTAEGIAKDRLVEVERARAEEQRLRTLADQRREEAERSARIAAAVNEFLNRDVLAAVDPRRTPNPDITMREVIDAAAEKLDQRFKDDPLVEASVRRTIGDTYRSLGLYDRALPHLERASSLFIEHAGDEDAGTLGAVNDLAILYRTLGRFTEAEPLYLKGIEIRRKTLGPDSRETIAATINLGVLYKSVGRLADAERLLSECVESMTRVLGPEHNDTILAKFHLAATYQAMQRWTDAEPLFRAALAHQTKSLGEDHPYTLVSAGSLASVLTELGRFDEAEPLYLRTLESTRRRLGERHADTAMSMANLGMFYRRLNRFDEAAGLLERALEIMREKLGLSHPETIALLNNLGTVFDYAGRMAEAEPHYAAAAQAGREHLRETNWLRGLYIVNHGVCLVHLNRLDEAEPILLEGLQLLTATVGPSHEQTRRACLSLANLHEARGEMEKAAEYRRSVQEQGNSPEG